MRSTTLLGRGTKESAPESKADFKAEGRRVAGRSDILHNRTTGPLSGQAAVLPSLIPPPPGRDLNPVFFPGRPQMLSQGAHVMAG